MASGQKIIEKISDLIDVVYEWEQKFFDYSKGFPLAWYRGQADAEWDLLPTVLRKWFLDRLQHTERHRGLPWDLWTREATINRQFPRMAASMLPGEASLVDVYFLAHHHGMPSRLLDWSTNALAALFFAVCELPDKDGVVYVINPRFLLPPSEDPGHPTFPDDVVDMRDDLLKKVVTSLYGEGKRETQAFVLPVLPDLTAGRILQQDSCFSLHIPPALGPDQQAVEEPACSIMEAEHAEKLLVPASRKRDLLIALRRLAIHWATLFPDPQHVVQEICTAWDMYP